MVDSDPFLLANTIWLKTLQENLFKANEDLEFKLTNILLCKAAYQFLLTSHQAANQ